MSGEKSLMRIGEYFNFLKIFICQIIIPQCRYLPDFPLEYYKAARYLP